MLEQGTSWDDLLQIVDRCAKLFKETSGVLQTLDGGTLALLGQSIPFLQNDNIGTQLRSRERLLHDRKIRIMVAGEESTGKTTLMNTLLAGNYLPVKHRGNTKVVCVVRNSQIARATVHYADPGQEPLKLNLSRDPSSPDWKRLKYIIENERDIDTEEDDENEIIDLISIDWPLDVLQDPQADGVSHTLQYNQLSQNSQRTLQPPRNERSDTVGSQASTSQDSFDTSQTNVKELDRRATTAYHSFRKSLPNSAPKSDPEVKRLFRVSGLERPRSDPDDTPVKQVYNSGPNTDEGFNSIDPTHTTPRSIPETGTQASKTDDVTEVADLTGSVSCAGDEDRDFQIEFLDCPGIKQEELPATLKHCTSCDAFIFVIDISHFGDDSLSRMQELITKLEERLHLSGKEFNQKTTLFIFNKRDLLSDLDDVERDEETSRAFSALQGSCPFIQKNTHIVETDGKKLLKAAVSRSTTAVLENFYTRIRNFVKATAYHTLEEYSLWLLNTLEVCHSIVGAGSKWANRREASDKAIRSIRDCESKIWQLEDQLDAKPEESRNRIHNRFCKQLAVFDSETSEVDSIITVLNTIDINRTWDELVSVLGISICNEIENNLKLKMRDYFENLKADHTKGLQREFKTETDAIQKLAKKLQTETGTDSTSSTPDPTLAFGLPLTFAAGGAIRLLPAFAPFVLLAVPLAPIPLLALTLRDEYKDWNNKKKEKLFHSNRDQFCREMIRSIITDCCNGKKTESMLFLHVFGNSVKKTLFDDLQQIRRKCECLRALLTRKATTNESAQRKLKTMVIETLKFYADKIMVHEIDQRVLIVHLDSRLGKGGQAQVFSGWLDNSVSGQTIGPVAVKRFSNMRHGHADDDPMSLSLPQNTDVYKECLIMREIAKKNCQNVVRYYGSCYTVNSDSSFTLDLVMERFDGDLNTVVQDKGELTKTEAERIRNFLSFALQCAKGLKTVHECKIVHRDVKPSNFLVRGSHVVISDVGSSKPANQIVTENRGTRVYLAPEIVTHRNLHDTRSDVYSLGLVFWGLWYRRPVYDEVRIEIGEVPRLENRSPADKAVRNIISSCIERDPNKRWSIQRVVKELKMKKDQMERQ